MAFRPTFRTKLLMLTIVPLAVAQFVTLIAVMRTVEKDVQADAEASLTIGATVVEEFLAARSDQLATSVSVLAADYGLKEAAATGDEATIQSVLQNHSRRVGADMAALVDLSGNVLGSTFAPTLKNRVDVQQLIADASGNSGESTALFGDAAYHLFSVPLRAPVAIGWIVLGFEIGQPVSERIAGLTGLDVSILHNGGNFMTVIATESHDPEQIDLRRDMNTVYMAAGEEDQSLTIQTPFLEGDPSVIVVLQRSMLEAMQPYVTARQALIAFAASLVLLVAIGGAWFSTTISKPLQTLGSAARRLMSGDYSDKVEVQSDDEFGELASSFNTMQTAIAEREQRISHQALHDPLTDLPNRSLVLTRLARLIENANKSDSKITILSLRFLRMSEISSTLGHHATDELIQKATRHLQKNLAADELLGQTGTNEFVLLLPGSDVEDALAYVDRIENLLGAGVALGRADIILQTQIGISSFPRHGAAAADLLRFAAIARTDAAASSERVRVYKAGREDEFLRRLRIVNELPAALQRGDIDTWLQPKMSLPDGSICGVEALVRWQHPELGFLSPDDFIPVAEQSGTIVVLTRHVIGQAVRLCRELEDAGFALRVSVNLSARDLLDEYLPYHIIQILRENSFRADRLTLEVTESSIMEDLNRSVALLEALRDLDVRISMDDFGTGHSSLSQLRNIPLHELKIDKSFVQGLCNDNHNDAIVRTTIELAHGMGLDVVAEGVEDEQTLRRLASYGCEQAQGYYLSKALPASELATWLADFRPRPCAERRGSDRAFAS